MHILVTGSGTSGSWQIRGEQLGRAIGATVIPKCLDVGGYHAAIVVKRPLPDLIARLHKADVPIIWDVVDGWPQPSGNGWGRAVCMSWMHEQFERIRPFAVVAATLAMEEDLGEFGVSVIRLPHHGRPGLGRNPVREAVKTVGYEGGTQYLGRWWESLDRQCRRRGWKFVVNPPSIVELDIVVAMRDAVGYAPSRWKSNVKLANAQASGTPFIGSPEAGYLEMSARRRERWATSEDSLDEAFDELTPYDERLRVSQAMLRVAPKLDDVAREYKSWLRAICETVPSS